MTNVVHTIFWTARCDTCGWTTDAPNEAEVVCHKVATHLAAFHRDTGADVSIASYRETRPQNELPALGRLATAPPGVVVTDAP
jgi:hypothetical protein